MSYHPVRRVAAFLAACAVLGTPAGLAISRYQYEAAFVWQMASGGLLAVVMLAFAIFVTKSNNVPLMALNVTRLLAAFVAVTLAGVLVIVPPYIALHA